MLTHEQATLPNGIQVDAGLGELLTSLWGLGLRTAYSCQGVPTEAYEEVPKHSMAYILFPEPADAWSFFARTLEAISIPERKADIEVTVRFRSKMTPDCEPLKPGPAVSFELTLDPLTAEPRLRGCVRFDPDLLPQVEAAFAEERTVG